MAGVWSLSEPDVYLDLMMQRARLDPAEIPGLIAACTRLLFRPPADRPSHTLAVKFRSGNISQADLYRRAFPEAALRLPLPGRPGLGALVALFRPRLGCRWPTTVRACEFCWWIMTAGADADRLEPPIDTDRADVWPEEVEAPVWAFGMEEYLRQFRVGAPLLAIRYNEFNADRTAVLERLFRHCGLPVERGSGCAARLRARLAGRAFNRAGADGRRPSPPSIATVFARRWRGIRGSPRPTCCCPTWMRRSGRRDETHAAAGKTGGQGHGGSANRRSEVIRLGDLGAGGG